MNSLSWVAIWLLLSSSLTVTAQQLSLRYDTPAQEWTEPRKMPDYAWTGSWSEPGLLQTISYEGKPISIKLP